MRAIRAAWSGVNCVAQLAHVGVNCTAQPAHVICHAAVTVKAQSALGQLRAQSILRQAIHTMYAERHLHSVARDNMLGADSAASWLSTCRTNHDTGRRTLETVCCAHLGHAGVDAVVYEIVDRVRRQLPGWPVWA